jgi:galactose mutarotase-like enzyme
MAPRPDGRIRHTRFFNGTTYLLPTDRNPPHAIHGTVLDRPWSVDSSGWPAVRTSSWTQRSWRSDE